MKQSIISISTCFLIGVLFSSPVAQGQNSDGITTQYLRDMVNTNQISLGKTANANGSPYLFDNFYDGSLKLVNGQASDVVPIRYNAHEMTVEFNENNTAFIMDPNTIKEFEIYVENSTYVFKKGFEARRLSEDEFVQMIIDDEVKFMAKHTVSFQQGVASYGSAAQQVEYLPNITYYMKVRDDDVNRIRRLSERRVMRNIDYFEGEIEDFADKNNIDFSDPNDLEKLLLHYNSLLQE